MVVVDEWVAGCLKGWGCELMLNAMEEPRVIPVARCKDGNLEKVVALVDKLKVG